MQFNERLKNTSDFIDRLYFSSFASMLSVSFRAAEAIDFERLRPIFRCQDMLYDTGIYLKSKLLYYSLPNVRKPASSQLHVTTATSARPDSIR
jgi:hypothetical protein